MGYLRVQAGDVGFTRGQGFVSLAIRYATTGPDERPSIVNHTLMFTSDGIAAPLQPGLAVPVVDQARCIEALWHVQHHKWWNAHKHQKGDKIYVYRPLFLSEEARDRVVRKALQYDGANYGWFKLPIHLVDRVLFGNRKVFSRLLFIDSYPICSYLIANAFADAGFRIAFGSEIPPEAQDPDNQMDHCEDYSDGVVPEWEFVGVATIC